MKLLVICQEYPSDQNRSVSSFAHSRNCYYEQLGHEVSVLSFSARQPYKIDGIHVAPEYCFSGALAKFDAWIIHMPNVRNALRFLIKNRCDLKRLAMIIHGHEFTAWQSEVPQYFPFLASVRGRAWHNFLKLYDWLKLRVWNLYFRTRMGAHTKIVFVSSFMQILAEKHIGISFDRLKIDYRVIHNPIHRAFVDQNYRVSEQPLADFVTLRPFDEPKYGVDLLVEIAKRHPQFTFHLYGRGHYFDKVSPPPNLKVLRGVFPADELPGLLNQYRAAILPTRWDSQGVLMCEVASFGMPLWVSDIQICQQMVSRFENVRFFSNENLDFNLYIPNPAVKLKDQAHQFLVSETALRELQFIL